MKFTPTTMAAFCVSLGVLSLTGVARADGTCPDSKLSEKDRLDALTSLRNMTQAVHTVRRKTLQGDVDAEWSLDETDPCKPVLVIDETKAKGSAKQAIKEQVKIETSSTVTGQKVADRVVPPPPPAPQTNTARDAAFKACKDSGGNFNDFEKDLSKACVKAAQVKTDPPKTDPAKPDPSKTVVVKTVKPSPEIRAAGGGGVQTNLASSEQPKPQMKAEAVKIEAPKPEVKAEPVKTEAPKPEVKAEPVKTEAPKPEVKTDTLKTANPALLDLQTKLKSSHDTLSQTIDGLKANGGDPGTIDMLTSQLSQVDSMNVSLGSVINQAAQSTVKVADTVTDNNRVPAEQTKTDPPKTDPVKAQPDASTNLQSSSKAPTPGSIAECWVDKDSKLDMVEGTHDVNGKVVEGWYFTRPGEKTEQFITGTICGQDGSCHTGNRKEVQTLIEATDPEVHRRSKLEITVVKVKNETVHIVGGAACSVKRAVWDKSLVPAGKAVAGKFKRHHIGNTILRTPVIFAEELLKPAISGIKKFLCFGSKWIIPIRPIVKGIRNSGEKTGLHNRLDDNDGDFRALVGQATAEGLLSDSEATALFDDDEKSIDVDAVWYTVDEAPRKSKDSFCTKGTGEVSHPELGEAISDRYSPQGNTATPAVDSPGTIEDAIRVAKASKAARDAAAAR